MFIFDVSGDDVYILDLLPALSHRPVSWKASETLVVSLNVSIHSSAIVKSGYSNKAYLYLTWARLGAKVRK
jgi:hypothetical protein